MKKIYIAVILLLAVSILLFFASFVYLDKYRHRIYYYTVNADDRDIGLIRVDEFRTEDKIIYKASADMPLAQLFTSSRSRLVFDNTYNLESYSREQAANGVTELIYLENRKEGASFVSRAESRFACLQDIPVRKDIFIFEETAPETYLPIIRNYNFAKGKSQGFSCLSFFSRWNLPPVKRFVTLTSMKNEYLKIDKRKIRTEFLLLKIKNYPQGAVWVARADRSLVRIELPSIRLKITRTFSPGLSKKQAPKEYRLNDNSYTTKDVEFKSKTLQLAGTLATPKAEGKHPAVLLLWGDGPQDRWYQGLFTSISDFLAKNGYCVLSFDKRGVGSSNGNAYSSTTNDIVEDASAAVDFLSAQNEVDPSRIFVLGHGRGAFYALKAAQARRAIKGLIFMAPSIYLGQGTEEMARLRFIASKFKWDSDYTSLASKCIEGTMNRAKSSLFNSVLVLGKRCFTKEMKEALADKPIELIKNIKAPVLILQGKEDEETPMEFVDALDKAFQENGTSNHTVRYYSYLGHFLSKRIDDGLIRVHYETDDEVLTNIKEWLDGNLSTQEAVPAPN